MSVSLSVAERTKPFCLVSRHSSCDLVSWNFLSWFQVRVSPTQPTTFSPSIPASTDQMTGSHKAAERGIISLERIKQVFVSCCHPPQCLSLCLPVCLHISPLFSLCMILSGCLSSYMSITPVCVCLPAVFLFPRCPSSCLTESVYLPLSLRLSRCNLT